VIVAAAAAFLFVVLNRDAAPKTTVVVCPPTNDVGPFRVDVVAGSPRCGGQPVAGPVTLATGAWLETDRQSRAVVAVADVGALELSPDTRLALISTSADEHRFSMSRGKIHAKVDAPPRLFVVTTPSAEAVDLGCEYDLEVDADGGSSITVTDGAVSLEGTTHSITVLAGYRARTLPSIGPTPAVRIEAPDELFEASVAVARGTGKLDAVLSPATSEDTATLIGLFPLVSQTQCEQVHSRLQQLSPMPFPWEQTDYGCEDISTLREAWTNLLSQTW